METVFLGFDLGSHASKGVLISDNGTVLASNSLEHNTAMPYPGWQEQESGVWWEEFKSVSKALLKITDLDPVEIKAVGITGFVPGLVFLDKDNSSIRPALMHTDIRAGLQLKYINSILHSPISHGFLMPKLLWIRDNEEETYRSTSKILVPHSFIVQKLTGKYSCDRDTAAIFGGVYDNKSGNWSNAVCDKLGINIDILPELYNSDSEVGSIGTEAAHLTGLSAGTPVITGTGDTFAALLGCGAVRSGDMMIYLGTSGTQLFIDGNIDNFIQGPHFGPGKAEFAGRIISCGDTMQHYRNILGFQDWAFPDLKALEINPGSDGLFIFPHLKQKTGVDFSDGDRETIFGLNSSHSNWHIYRAVMEGIAANLKTDFLAYESRVKRLILSGGGARSRVFREIISAMLDRDIYYNPLGDGSVGVALLAGYSITGLPLKEASLLISKSAEITWPVAGSVAVYKKNYKKYSKLRNAIEELYKQHY